MVSSKGSSGSPPPDHPAMQPPAPIDLSQRMPEEAISLDRPSSIQVIRPVTSQSALYSEGDRHAHPHAVVHFESNLPLSSPGSPRAMPNGNGHGNGSANGMTSSPKSSASPRHAEYTSSQTMESPRGSKSTSRDPDAFRAPKRARTRSNYQGSSASSDDDKNKTVRPRDSSTGSSSSPVGMAGYQPRPRNGDSRSLIQTSARSKNTGTANSLLSPPFPLPPLSPRQSFPSSHPSISTLRTVSDRPQRIARTAVDRLRDEVAADEGGNISGNNGGGGSSTSSTGTGSRKRAQSLQTFASAPGEGNLGDGIGAGEGYLARRSTGAGLPVLKKKSRAESFAGEIPGSKGRTLVGNELGKGNRQRSNTTSRESSRAYGLAPSSRRPSRGESMRSVTPSQSLPIGLARIAIEENRGDQGLEAAASKSRAKLGKAKGKQRADFGLGFESAMGQQDVGLLPNAAIQSVLSSMDLTNALRLIAQQGVIPSSAQPLMTGGLAGDDKLSSNLSVDASLRSVSPIPRTISTKPHDPFIATAPPPLIPDEPERPKNVSRKSWQIPLSRSTSRVGDSGKREESQHVENRVDSESDSDLDHARPRSSTQWKIRKGSDVSSNKSTPPESPVVARARTASNVSAQESGIPVANAFTSTAESKIKQSHEAVGNDQRGRNRLSSLFHRKPKIGGDHSAPKHFPSEVQKDEHGALAEAQDRVQAALLQIPQHPMAEKMAYQTRSHFQAHYNHIYRSINSPSLQPEDSYLRHNPLRILRWRQQTEAEEARKKSWESSLQAQADVQYGSGDLDADVSNLLMDSPVSVGRSIKSHSSPASILPWKKRESLQRTISRTSKASSAQGIGGQLWHVSPQEVAMYQARRGNVHHFVPSAEAVALLATTRSDRSRATRDSIRGRPSVITESPDKQPSTRDGTSEHASNQSEESPLRTEARPHSLLRSRHPSRESLKASDAIVSVAKAPFRMIRHGIHRHHDLGSAPDISTGSNRSDPDLAGGKASIRTGSGTSQVTSWTDFAYSKMGTGRHHADSGNSSLRAPGEEYRRRMGQDSEKGNRLNLPVLAVKPGLRDGQGGVRPTQVKQNDNGLHAVYESRAQNLSKARDAWARQIEDVDASAEAPSILLSRIQAEGTKISLITGLEQPFPEVDLGTSRPPLDPASSSDSRLRRMSSKDLQRRSRRLTLLSSQSAKDLLVPTTQKRPVYEFSGQRLDAISRLDFAIKILGDGYAQALDGAGKLSGRQDELQHEVSDMITQVDDLRTRAEELGLSRVRKSRALLDQLRLPTDRPVDFWAYAVLKYTANTLLGFARGYVYVRRFAFFIFRILVLLVWTPVWFLLTPLRWLLGGRTGFLDTKGFLYCVIGFLVILLGYSRLAKEIVM